MNLTKKKLKISLVASDLSAQNTSLLTGENRPFLLAHALKKIGYDVEIVGLAFDSNSPTLFDPEIKVSSVPCSYYSGLINASKQLLSQINGDLIYAVKLKPTSFGLSIVKKLLSNKPLILDIDDWDLSSYGGENFQYKPSLKQLIKDFIPQESPLRYPDHPLYISWLEKLTSYADLITSYNSFLQERFGGIYLPNATDINLFNPEKYDNLASKKKYDLSDYKTILFYGINEINQGLDDTLKALELINKPEYKLIIIGEINWQNYDEKLREKWGQWIVEIPETSVNLIPEIIAAADLLVIPQKNNTITKVQFPLQLIKGMAMEKAILATKVGDIPNILADTGFLIEPASPEQIATGIEYIFNHPELAKITGKNARERFIKYFTIDSMAAILEQIINHLFPNH